VSARTANNHNKGATGGDPVRKSMEGAPRRCADFEGTLRVFGQLAVTEACISGSCGICLLQNGDCILLASNNRIRILPNARTRTKTNNDEGAIK
jgi:hypothetical protein